GRPSSISASINGGILQWNESSILGQELIDTDIIQYFAVHGQRITNMVNIQDDSLYVYMNGDTPLGQQFSGWYSLQFIFLYSSPSITDTTYLNIYTASQPQTILQEYIFQRPDYKAETDVGFSI